MPHTNVKPSPKRWEYLKFLKPHPGRVLYVNRTHDVRRNKRKLMQRALTKFNVTR